MRKYSFSFVDLYRRCPMKWYYKYGLKLEVEDDLSPTHPFKIGHLLHTAIEKDINTAREEYYMKYPIIGNDHINEVIKVNHYSNLVKGMLPDGEHEVQIETDDFIGIIDYVAYNKDGTVDLYDFKYSNNVNEYMRSGQLHVYKYYYELVTGRKVSNLYYIFIPKYKGDPIRTVEDRRKLDKWMLNNEPVKRRVEYDPAKLSNYFNLIYEIEETSELVKNIGYQCDWCEYKNICLQIDKYMV